MRSIIHVQFGCVIPISLNTTAANKMQQKQKGNQSFPTGSYLILKMPMPLRSFLHTFYPAQKSTIIYV
jgi:hypothetical protein